MGVPPGSRSTRTARPMDFSRSASKAIWVDLPLPSLPSKVINRPFIEPFSETFGLWPFRRIVNDPAFGLQFVSNRIGTLKVFGSACFLPGVHKRGDLGRHVDRRRGADAEHGVDPLPRSQRGRRVRSAQSLGCELPVNLANPFEDRAPSTGNIQIFVQRLGELLR